MSPEGIHRSRRLVAILSGTVAMVCGFILLTSTVGIKAGLCQSTLGQAAQAASSSIHSQCMGYEFVHDALIAGVIIGAVLAIVFGISYLRDRPRSN